MSESGTPPDENALLAAYLRALVPVPEQVPVVLTNEYFEVPGLTGKSYGIYYQVNGKQGTDIVTQFPAIDEYPDDVLRLCQGHYHQVRLVRLKPAYTSDPVMPRRIAVLDPKIIRKAVLIRYQEHDQYSVGYINRLVRKKVFHFHDIPVAKVKVTDDTGTVHQFYQEDGHFTSDWVFRRSKSMQITALRPDETVMPLEDRFNYIEAVLQFSTYHTSDVDCTAIVMAMQRLSQDQIRDRLNETIHRVTVGCSRHDVRFQTSDFL